jgi:hypothetical protein
LIINGSVPFVEEILGISFGAYLRLNKDILNGSFREKPYFCLIKGH